jgi:hypothetical protein
MTQIRYPESPLLKDIAHELVKLYDDTLFKGAVKPEAILFIESTDSKASEDKIDAGEAKVFEIKELPPPVAERLNADYLIIFHKLNAAEMEGAKVNAHFLEALMRIKPGGGLRQPDVKTFVDLARGLGPDWKKQQFVALDVRMGELYHALPKQQKLDFTAQGNGINLKPTETATLHVGGDGPPRLVVIGPEGSREIPARTVGGDNWQTDGPLVTKDQVEQFRPATPNISGTGSD